MPCLWVRSDEGAGEHTILYLHGGGLVDGAALTHRELASRLAERLRQAGRAVTLRVWSGPWHVWPREARLPHAQAALEQIAAFLRD